MLSLVRWPSRTPRMSNKIMNPGHVPSTLKQASIAMINNFTPSVNTYLLASNIRNL